MLALSIGNELLISSVADTKYLGLQVDHYLSREQHVLLITKNFPKYRYASIQKVIYPFENYSVVVLLSLIETYFRCCCPVWGCVVTTTLQTLQKLQNRAVRVATNSRFDAPSELLT